MLRGQKGEEMLSLICNKQKRVIYILNNFYLPIHIIVDPDPDPTIKSHITRSKSNKLNTYFWEKYTFKKNQANSEKGGGRG